MPGCDESFDSRCFPDIAFGPHLVRWLSGRKRRFAKALYLKRVPRVRIPPSPVFPLEAQAIERFYRPRPFLRVIFAITQRPLISGVGTYVALSPSEQRLQAKNKTLSPRRETLWVGLFRIQMQPRRAVSRSPSSLRRRLTPARRASRGN